jgi:hypothetical protein
VGEVQIEVEGAPVLAPAAGPARVPS